MRLFVDIEKMGMWQPLQDLLTSEKSSDEVQAAVLWIIGTAVQNNPSAQNAVCTIHSDLFCALTHLSLLSTFPFSTHLSLLSFPACLQKNLRSKHAQKRFML